MPVRRIPRQMALLWRVSGTAARESGGARAVAAWRARRLRTRQGFDYDEALAMGLLDPTLPAAERAGAASRHHMLQALAPLNCGGEVPALAGDKVVFSQYCDALGLPVPRTYAVVDRRGSGWSAAGRPLFDGDDWEEFLAGAPDEIVVKPSLGYGGRGVAALHRMGESFAEAGGGLVAPRALWDRFGAHPEFAVWLVQERLHNHPDLEAMAGSANLHTVRIVTLMHRDGRVEVLMGVLKLALGEGPADNFVGGVTGTWIAPVDTPSGRAGLLHGGRQGARFAIRPTCPATGARVEGEILPFWEEACRLVLRAAPLFPPARALGWDVALTGTGPVLVETNTRWAMPPFPGEGARVLEALRRATHEPAP